MAGSTCFEDVTEAVSCAARLPAHPAQQIVDPQQHQAPRNLRPPFCRARLRPCVWRPLLLLPDAPPSQLPAQPGHQASMLLCLRSQTQHTVASKQGSPGQQAQGTREQQRKSATRVSAPSLFTLSFQQQTECLHISRHATHTHLHNPDPMDQAQASANTQLELSGSLREPVSTPAGAAGCSRTPVPLQRVTSTHPTASPSGLSSSRTPSAGSVSSRTRSQAVRMSPGAALALAMPRTCAARQHTATVDTNAMTFVVTNSKTQRCQTMLQMCWGVSSTCAKCDVKSHMHDY